jgi:chitin disaccharide deacetylase
MASIYFHSDDFGLSQNITDQIIDTIENGIITSVSIIANGTDWKRATDFVKSKKIKSFVHLNLSEGESTVEDGSISKIITDSNKMLNNNFLSLELRWLFSGSKKRQIIENALYSELVSQISRIYPIENGNISVDGHEHIHMSPLVFKTLLKIHRKYKIKQMRLSNDILLLKGSYFFRRYFYKNIIKYLVLKFLIIFYRKILNDENIYYDDYCFGIIHSGNISSEIIRYLKKRTSHKKLVIQVILHPGYARKEEIKNWKDIKNWTFYNDKKRIIEQSIAKDTDLLK